MFHNTAFALVATALIFGWYSPTGNFLATPKFWRDEAITFELSHTLVELGTLDVVVAPNQVDGRPYMTNATGFPVTAPLAAVFLLFGVGVWQARLYMLAWVVATALVSYAIMTRFLGERAARWGTLFIVTFSSFYANGKTLTGEIPGFLFLLLGLALFFTLEQYVFAGAVLMLASIAKPSMYIFILPSMVLAAWWSDRKLPLRKIVRMAVGALPVLLFWIYLILPNPFLLGSWKTLIDFYAHAFNAPSILSRGFGGIADILAQSTIWYFAVIAYLVWFAFRRGAYGAIGSSLVRFTIVYGAFAVVYFLRSPGWIRYLLGLELLLLLLLYPALIRFSERVHVPKHAFVLGVVLLHVLNFFFFSDVRSSAVSIETGAYINDILRADPGATIGFIYAPTIAPLVGPERKYQIGTIGGRDVYGTHPLARPVKELPDYVVGFNGEYREVLETFYIPFREMPNGDVLYHRRTDDVVAP